MDASKDFFNRHLTRFREGAVHLDRPQYEASQVWPHCLFLPDY